MTLFNVTFQTLLYEIAMRTLPRVCLLSNPGVVGVVLKESEAHGTLVHWGVADKNIVQTWHDPDTLHSWPFGVMMEGYVGDPANY